MKHSSRLERTTSGSSGRCSRPLRGRPRTRPHRGRLQPLHRLEACSRETGSTKMALAPLRAVLPVSGSPRRSVEMRDQCRRRASPAGIRGAVGKSRPAVSPTAPMIFRPHSVQLPASGSNMPRRGRPRRRPTRRASARDRRRGFVTRPDVIRCSIERRHVNAPACRRTRSPCAARAAYS